MNKQKERTIADSLKPTTENVIREFILGAMREIIFNDKKHSFRFIFEEKEAIDFLCNFIEKYSKDNKWFEEEAKKLKYELVNAKEIKNDIPALIIKDYKYFFESLRKMYEKVIELYFERLDMSGFSTYEMNNFFEQIWLRATPTDFNNIEEFLRRNVEMYYDTTFKKFDEETQIGKFKGLNDSIITVKNGIARTWDEAPRQFEIRIYDKKYYDNTNLCRRPHYECPVIRYGIFSKDGERICYIGSIQNKKSIYSDTEDIEKQFQRKKYKLNKDIMNQESEEYKNYIQNDKKDDFHPENISEVEPASIFALSLFINFLHREGITKIEVPSLYVLDYDYHIKKEKMDKEIFENYWTEDRIKRVPEMYKKEKEAYENSLGKVDIISENKTEKFIRTFSRITYHYPNSKINSYPGELDSFLHITIPKVKDRQEINNDMLKDMYDVVNDFYERSKEKER